MKRRTAAIIVLSATVLFSCATTGNSRSGYYTDNAVQVIDVNTASRYLSASSVIPPEAVIQPEELTVSPVIDIATLRAETERKTAEVSSATLAQEARKGAIEAALETDPGADTALDESAYGVTSGTLSVEAAEKSFTHISSGSSFTGAIAEYDYIEGRIYEIITSPRAITDFRLKPGESIAGQPVVSNSPSLWNFTMGTSVENGAVVQHLFIKPTTVGLDTSMIILTDERTYYFRIASFDQSYMTALRFRYPAETADGYFVAEDFEAFISEAAAVKEKDEFTINMANANFNYKISRYKGKPTWMPESVFSDGLKTYIQFPLAMLRTDEMPSVYVEKNGEVALVNYRIKGNLYMIDTIISDDQRILLKSGEKEQVRITRAR